MRNICADECECVARVQNKADSSQHRLIHTRMYVWATAKNLATELALVAVMVVMKSCSMSAQLDLLFIVFGQDIQHDKPTMVQLLSILPDGLTGPQLDQTPPTGRQDPPAPQLALRPVPQDLLSSRHCLPISSKLSNSSSSSLLW